MNSRAKDVVEKLDHAINSYRIELQRDLSRNDVHQVVGQYLKEILVCQKNHEERLKRIAEQNDGLIKVGSATDILYSHKLIKSESRIKAYHIIYKLLARMADAEIFNRTGPAEFRLASDESKRWTNS